MPHPCPLNSLQEKLLAFARARDWEQFHAPKNLAAALSVEAGELLEHFQWLSEADSHQLPTDTLHEVRLELADVFMYTLLLAKKLDVDLVSAAEDKIVLNEQRYPADKARGSARKYHAYSKPGDA